MSSKKSTSPTISADKILSFGNGTIEQRAGWAITHTGNVTGGGSWNIFGAIALTFSLGQRRAQAHSGQTIPLCAKQTLQDQRRPIAQARQRFKCLCPVGQ